MEGFVVALEDFSNPAVYRDSASTPLGKQCSDELIVTVGQLRRIAGVGVLCLPDIEAPRDRQIVLGGRYFNGQFVG